MVAFTFSVAKLEALLPIRQNAWHMAWHFVTGGKVRNYHDLDTITDAVANGILHFFKYTLRMSWHNFDGEINGSQSCFS